MENERHLGGQHYAPRRGRPRAGQPFRDDMGSSDDDDDDDHIPRRDARGGGGRRGVAEAARGGFGGARLRDNNAPMRGGFGGQRGFRLEGRDRAQGGRGAIGGGVGFAERGGGRGGGRGGERGERRGRRKLDVNYLRELKDREESDIALTLSHPESGFRDLLKDAALHSERTAPIIHVLSKAFQCNSTPENLTILFTIIKETRFFDTAINFFLDMRETNSSDERSFREPITNMITIMEELMEKNPNCITEFVGIHTVLKNVIDSLRQTSTVINAEILKRFQEFTEQKEKKLMRQRKRGRSRPTPDEIEQEQDLEGPPDDFRDIEIFPQTADMQVIDENYLRKNKIRGQYDDLDQYLDIQFRLLREDFVGPLRDGVNDYIQATAIGHHKKGKKLQDIRIYDNVRIISTYCMDVGICHILQFDVSRFHVRWQSSKRLIYGSLLCLSHDNFNTFFFATVTHRTIEELQRGHICVRLELPRNAISDLWDKTFTMAETTAYFESYKHVLLGLQKIRHGDLPFEKYILKCDNQVQPPAYLRRDEDSEFDLRPLVDEDIVIRDTSRLGNPDDPEDEVPGQRNYNFSQRSAAARHVTILNRNEWPPADLLHLDDSQYEAIHTALTNEFVITQGPPGTGKTYIGLKIVKALLHNKSLWSVNSVTGQKDQRPMLIVCYTNHALDQFLEGIVDFYKGDLIRIGSRSQSEKLKSYNLHNFRQRFRHERNVPVQIFQARREARTEMESLLGKINEISSRVQIATTTILHEQFLQPFIEPNTYQKLTQQFEMMLQVYPEARDALRRGYSVIVEWLGLGNLAPIVEMEGNIPAEMNDIPEGNMIEPEEELIDVEDEVDAIQAQRQLDDGDDDDDIEDLLDGLDIGLSRKEVNELKARQAIKEQMKAVAMHIDFMTEKPQNVNEYDWQYQKKERKRLKKQTLRNLASNDVMPEDEAKRYVDLWRMSMPNKWRMYRLWIRKYCDFLRSDIVDIEEEYEAAAARHKEALMQEDKEIMRQSTVIGMTTTGAARYQSVLQEIRPRIVVVEEAAEVLEAHIVTTLSRGCEHLILIGDHKQLRPNPTVYKLAKDYNLDVSLFERMATNGLRCDTLELQHRMRPEIAELMRHIYKGLKNHDSVLEYEDISGVSTNMYFIDHKQEESDDVDLKSHSNMHEARYLVALCKYLLLQGYKPNQITILTLYSGQLFCLRNMMPKDPFDGVRVTVVDNYQGEENDIILLSLVRSNEDGSIGFLKVENRICVALSRAKKGFYVIGNFELLGSHSLLWKEIVIDMSNRQLLGEGLLLHCQNHPNDHGIVATEPKDFDKAPEGGCDKMCEFRLECGHVCRMFCHTLDKDHEDYECRKLCNKMLCKNGHRCKRLCYQDCGDCTEIVEKKIPRCGHKQMVPCHLDPAAFTCQDPCKKTLLCQHICQTKCGNACTDKCSILIDHTWPCGHKGRVQCHMKSGSPCPEPCGDILECQHMCVGTCGTCFEGRLHRNCQMNCSRILVCGHQCPDRCNICPPCTMKCENRCNHSACGRRCGELCAPCMEPCQWKCKHHKCTKLCHEPCNRPRCDEPCRKRLQCGHICIGLCGEPCPNDCRVCDKDKVTEILFGTEDEPEARFVLLEDCRNRCIVEFTAMDTYMDTKVQNGEIQLKSCPKCKTPIRKNRRYGTIINKSLMEIENVKKQVLSNKDRLEDLEDDIMEELEDEPSETRLIMRRRLKRMGKPRTENALAAMKNQLTFLKLIRNLMEDWTELKGISVAGEKEKGLFNLERFKEWALEERSIMTQQETTDAEFEYARSKDLLRILLYQKQLVEHRKTVDAEVRFRMRQAEETLKKTGKYTDAKKNIVGAVLDELKKVLGSLGISDDEKLMIVKAMALPAGHWFECPRGHVYAIGDCGGATEEGQCPECNATIGGTGHRLREDNRIAGHMDGAQHAAWSEQANLGNYGFNAEF